MEHSARRWRSPPLSRNHHPTRNTAARLLNLPSRGRILVIYCRNVSLRLDAKLFWRPFLAPDAALPTGEKDGRRSPQMPGRAKKQKGWKILEICRLHWICRTMRPRAEARETWCSATGRLPTGTDEVQSSSFLFCSEQRKRYRYRPKSDVHYRPLRRAFHSFSKKGLEHAPDAGS